MTTDSGPIYEVAIFVAPEAVEDCDRILEEHVRRSLRNASVIDCHVFTLDDDAEEQKRRICVHHLSNDESLNDFVDVEAEELETEFAEHVGNAGRIVGRVLREDETTDLVGDASPDCLNCGRRLRGQYCANCGQRSRSRLISLWELVSDAFGDLLELDSRLWQTLIPLMIRPGRLTSDYLQGKRARFMPPFRMYLVLSLLFFVVAFFDPREDLSILFEPVPEPTADEQAAAFEESQQEVQEVLEELEAEGILEEGQATNIQLDNTGIRFSIDDEDIDEDNDCEYDASDLEDMPQWLSRRLTAERLERVCERVQLDDGRSFANSILDNIPAALIILLPIMAFVLKALYPLSKRYYVEHLLFFVHFHAFFFLMLTLQILLIRIGFWIGIAEAIPILIVIALSFYIAAYLFVAMRRVYGQGRFITFLKYVVLLIAYLTGFSLTMLGAVAIAAFSL